MFISVLVKSLSRGFCKTMPCLPAMTGNCFYTYKFIVDFFKDGDFDGDAHSFPARQGSATLSKPKITTKATAVTDKADNTAFMEPSR